uniref:Uncharacterized protein n=1 Tax=Hyaloperonospora arabidopsidis (strain Emoy2) TaxID=559515 RepID=M4BQ13_HYAAE
MHCKGYSKPTIGIPSRDSDFEKLLERIEKQQFQQQDRTEPYIPLMLLGDSSWYECGEAARPGQNRYGCSVGGVHSSPA